MEWNQIDEFSKKQGNLNLQKQFLTAGVSSPPIQKALPTVLLIVLVLLHLTFNAINKPLDPAIII